MMSLFQKECAQIIKSVTYPLYVVVLVAFLMSQIGELKMMEEPKPGQADYGWTKSKDQQLIMTDAVNTMALEWVQNYYTAYPFGFYKRVSISESDQKAVGEILEKVTGLTQEEVREKVADYLDDVSLPDEYGLSAGEEPNLGEDGALSAGGSDGEIQDFHDLPAQETPPDEELPPAEISGSGLGLTPSPSLTYEQFGELMDEADKHIGGGSNYSKSFRENLIVPATYEDALAEYQELIEKDQVTRAYARLFCDYAGIMLGILPVFVAVARGLKDRRHEMQDLIYSRSISTVRLILVRTFAMLFLLLLPVLLYAGFMTVKFAGPGRDLSAFLVYSLGWLAPTVLVSMAVGMFLTELTDTPIAIAAQGVWWMYSMFSGLSMMGGGYGMNLMPRHNDTGGADIFREYFGTLAFNRIFYALLAVALIAGTAFIYDRKRRGRYHGLRKMRKNRGGESEA